MGNPNHTMRYRNFVAAILLASLLILGLVIAIWLMSQSKYPLENIRHGYRFLKYKVVGIRPPEPSIAMDSAEIGKLLTLTSDESIHERRKTLKTAMRGAQCLFDTSITNTEEVESSDSEDARIHSPTVLLIKLPFGFVSQGRFYVGTRPKGILVFYNTGHSGLTEIGAKNIGILIREGFDVIALDMPLNGNNIRPTLSIDRVGKVTFTRHEQLSLLESKDFNPLVLFVEPIVCLVNHFTKANGYKRIVQIGFSGGANTSTLSAALDSRIAKTYAVAGVSPQYLRFASPITFHGDYEQAHKSILDIASDLDLYVMAAYGKNRRYVQVFNKFDPCCYPGEAFNTYAPHIRDRIHSLGLGEFDVWLDESHFDHQVSQWTLSKIISELS